MASFSQHCNNIEYALKDSIIRLTEYQKEVQLLREENAQLKKQLEEEQQEKNGWREKHNLVTITHTLLKKEDKTEVKKEINELVREIDNCIGFINGENGNGR